MVTFFERLLARFLAIFDVKYKDSFVQCIKDLTSSNTFLVFCLLLFLFFFFIYISNRLFSILTFMFLLCVIFNVDIEEEVKNFPERVNNMIVGIKKTVGIDV